MVSEMSSLSMYLSNISSTELKALILDKLNAEFIRQEKRPRILQYVPYNP